MMLNEPWRRRLPLRFQSKNFHLMCFFPFPSSWLYIIIGKTWSTLARRSGNFEMLHGNISVMSASGVNPRYVAKSPWQAVDLLRCEMMMVSGNPLIPQILLHRCFPCPLRTWRNIWFLLSNCMPWQKHGAGSTRTCLNPHASSQSHYQSLFERGPKRSWKWSQMIGNLHGTNTMQKNQVNILFPLLMFVNSTRKALYCTRWECLMPSSCSNLPQLCYWKATAPARSRPDEFTSLSLFQARHLSWVAMSWWM